MDTKIKNRRKVLTNEEKDTVLRAAVTIAVILLLAGIVVVIIRIRNPRVDIKEGQEKLAQMEEVQVSDVDSQIQELEKAERDADEAWANRPVNEKFANAFVIGDSVTQGLYLYGVLDQSHVQADKGAGVCGAGAELLEVHMEKAAAYQPQVLFLAYGMNDIGNSNGDSEVFITAYGSVLDRLKEALPDTKIYVNSILPVQQFVIDGDARFGLIPEYNQKLGQLCEEKEVTFIENGDLVEEDYYSDDGIHMMPDYYTKWTEHMAEAAEL